MPDRSPVLAALLSLIFPGLGQVYAGAVRRGIVWMLPTVALILVAIFIIVTKTSLTGLVTSQATLAVIALEFAFLFYHVAAMIDAYGIAARERRVTGAAASGAGIGALIALLIVALLIHGYPIYQSGVLDAFANLLFPGRVLLPSASFSLEPTLSIPPEETDSPEPTEPGATPTGTAGPTPTAGQSTPQPTALPPLNTPWGDRLNLLLVGTDAGPDRPGGRTDTMILLSVEIATGKAALFGFPRNMNTVPIEDAAGTGTFNRVWKDPFPPGNGDPGQSLLTNLWQFAREHPDQFFTPTDACQPTDPNLERCLGYARGFRATQGAIRNLAGVEIHGLISVNLTAFKELVDALGGVWIDVPQAIYDDAYPVGEGDTESPKVINIPKGCSWFNGVYALAYARSRHQDSDYQRMKRQQLVLQAVRRQFDPVGLLSRLDELLNVASNNMWTTISRDDIPLLAQVASRVDADRLYQVRFTPGAGYDSTITSDEIHAIRSRVQNIFSQPQPEPTPRPSNKPPSCPAPGQTPGPTFSTKLSPKP